MVAYLRVIPPICSPHLVVLTIDTISITVEATEYAIRRVSLVSLERRIAEKVPDALHGIALPQFNVFGHEVAVLVLDVSFDGPTPTRPCGSLWELVDELQEASLVVEGEAHGTNLSHC